MASEVDNLDGVISKANHSHAHRMSIGACREQHLAHTQAKLREARELLRDMCLDQAATNIAANRREVAVAAAGTQLCTLDTDLAEAEAAVSSSRGAESLALSVARTYRDLAARAGSHLNELLHVLAAAELRLHRHVEQLKRATRITLRQQNLRAVLGAREMAAVAILLQRWKRYVAMQHCWSLASGHFDTGLLEEVTAHRSGLSDAKADSRAKPF